MGGASVYYGATEDLSSVGVSGSIAGFTVGVGNSSSEWYKRRKQMTLVLNTLLQTASQSQLCLQMELVQLV